MSRSFYLYLNSDSAPTNPGEMRKFMFFSWKMKVDMISVGLFSSCTLLCFHSFVALSHLNIFYVTGFS